MVGTLGVSLARHLDNDIETRRKWSGHWEFHEHGTLRVVGDGALGVSKSMHYELMTECVSEMAGRGDSLRYAVQNWNVEGGD